MAGRLGTWLDRLRDRRTRARWTRLAEAAAAADPETLRALRSQARGLRRQVDRVIHEADYRLALPVIGANPIPRPWGTDWAWRPELWRGRIPVPGLASVPGRTEVAEGATLFHDCRQSELTFRQIRNARAEDIAPFGFRIDVFRFDGSYLSLALDLPGSAVQGLRLNHLIRVDVIAEMEKPLELFARLNVRHGPNTEQMVREVQPGAEAATVEFDLAYSKIDERRIERLWLDLIFEGPEMNQIILRDVTLSRRPRAAL